MAILHPAAVAEHITALNRDNCDVQGALDLIEGGPEKYLRKLLTEGGSMSERLANSAERQESRKLIESLTARPVVAMTLSTDGTSQFPRFFLECCPGVYIHAGVLNTEDSHTQSQQAEFAADDAIALLKRCFAGAIMLGLTAEQMEAKYHEMQPLMFEELDRREQLSKETQEHHRECEEEVQTQTA